MSRAPTLQTHVGRRTIRTPPIPSINHVEPNNQSINQSASQSINQYFCFRFFSHTFVTERPISSGKHRSLMAVTWVAWGGGGRSSPGLCGGGWGRSPPGLCGGGGQELTWVAWGGQELTWVAWEGRRWGEWPLGGAGGSGRRRSVAAA